MYLPSERVGAFLQSARAGVCIGNSSNAPSLWLVAKLPHHLIRAIYAGLHVELNVHVVSLETERVVVYGLSVHDDPEHPIVVSGTCRSAVEVNDLAAVLKLESVPVQFHNENQLPLLAAIGGLEATRAKEVVSAFPSEDRFSEDHNLHQESLDIIERWGQAPSQRVDRIVARCTMPLVLEEFEVFNNHLLTLGEISLHSDDQGKELEVLTLQLLDQLFPYGAYHSPQRDDAKGLLELCDILAVSRIREVESEGVFVIQNKAAMTDGRLLSTERRGRTIQKHIRKGIKQSIGAVKQLKKGLPTYKQDGSNIEDDPPEIVGEVEPLDLRGRAQEVGFGIILISDMHEGVDWKDVWQRLIAATQKTKYYHLVLDLRELHLLVNHAKGRPALLETYLIERWKEMLRARTPMIRSHFGVPTTTDSTAIHDAAD